MEPLVIRITIKNTKIRKGFQDVTFAKGWNMKIQKKKNKNKNKNKYKNKHKQNHSNNVEANSSGIKDYDYQDAFISNALNEDFNNQEYNNVANSALINNKPRHYKRKNTTKLR